MKDLKSIIKSLNAKEIKFISDYYKNNDEKKRLMLFKGVLSGSLTTDEAAAKKTYGKKGSAYSHLKTRLKEDLLNLLLFIEEDKTDLSEVIKAELEVDRLIFQAKILHRRKATNYAIKLLKKAYELCIKFELIKEKVIVNYWYSIVAGNKLGIEIFEQINANLDSDIDLLKDYLLAFNERYRLSLNNKFSIENEEKIIENAKRSMIYIGEIYNKNNSNNIGYYYYLTAISYYNLKKNYKLSFELASKLNNLIVSNFAVNSIVREVNSFLQLFNSCLFLEKYSEATLYALQAFKKINGSRLKGSMNELTVLEYIFRSNLRERKSKQLNKHLQNGINHPQINLSVQVKEKWIFFEAAFHFSTNQHNKSLDSLTKINVLLQDKAGWLFTFKLLEIMCYIELEEFDMVHYRIETFRKLLSKKDNVHYERVKTIHQILKSLLKYGFNFKQVYKLEENNLKLLIDAHDEYSWNPLGFEIIRFDEWFLQKLES